MTRSERERDSILHIADGDMTAQRLKQSGVPGEILSWQEAAIHGPSPGGVVLGEWQAIRADFLARSAGVPSAEVLRSLESMHASLRDHREEIVLWFGEESFCQHNLASVVSSIMDDRVQRVSIVGLGTGASGRATHGSDLEVAELLTGYESRTELGIVRRDELNAFWRAFSDSDPSRMLRLSREAEASARIVALACSHLQRFPSAHNGLGVLENTLLTLVASGIHRFDELFETYAERNPSSGLGDVQILDHLTRLANCDQPLVSLEGDPPDTLITILPVGHEVLSGQRDFVELNGIDLWLGGVHMTGSTSLWRWDTASSTLVTQSGGA
ncbi:MAG TPA: hypothetical protein VNM92_14525 [Thermoanaerobaculia bacterium]|nr:hypothetical protein [Thermoanaerobaculia bacterium]